MDGTADSMSEKLKALTNVAPFTAVVGDRFRASWGGEESTELELISATGLRPGMRAPGDREPFSLLFRAMAAEFHLPQGMYRLEHEKFGALDIFLVPVGPDEKGMRLEAVFN
jgi:hypothetical protein